ncbi:MAG: PEP-CTERM sorting domain-containing protein [Planctomycetota bacterium]|nr:PEP-CTERM sorting domain-containing protein [Planctomycetota bacterium]
MRKLAFLLVMIGLAVPVYSQDFLWTGAAGDGKYLTGTNWDPTGPPVAVEGICRPVINNGDTVTVDGTGAIAGDGWHDPMIIGDATGEGHLLIVDGGDILGEFRIGDGEDGVGYGTVVQTGGAFYMGGGCADAHIQNGTYHLQGGVLGSDLGDPDGGLGYTEIGRAGGTGTLIQEAGTVVRTRADYYTAIGYNSTGTYTMNGGALDTLYLWLGGVWGTTTSTTWNINSTDVDITLGRNYIMGEKGDPGIHVKNGGDMYVTAVEGLPGQTGQAGQTVLVKIIGGSFDNQRITPSGEDADVAGFNNITLAFEKNAPSGASNASYEVAGRDLGADVAGLTNNWALEGLVVGGAAGGADAVYLTMMDDYDNPADDIYDDEGYLVSATPDVLYTNILTVNPDSYLLLNGKTIYYYKGEINGLVIADGGSLIQIDWVKGDANWDIKVDGSDLNQILTGWGTGTEWDEGDFNDDDAVDGSDLNWLLTNWTYPPAAASVPEPATLGILALGALALVRRRRA